MWLQFFSWWNLHLLFPFLPGSYGARFFLGRGRNTLLLQSKVVCSMDTKSRSNESSTKRNRQVKCQGYRIPCHSIVSFHIIQVNFYDLKSILVVWRQFRIVACPRTVARPLRTGCSMVFFLTDDQLAWTSCPTTAGSLWNWSALDACLLHAEGGWSFVCGLSVCLSVCLSSLNHSACRFMIMIHIHNSYSHTAYSHTTESYIHYTVQSP